MMNDVSSSVDPRPGTSAESDTLCVGPETREENEGNIDGTVEVNKSESFAVEESAGVDGIDVDCSENKGVDENISDDQNEIPVVLKKKRRKKSNRELSARSSNSSCNDSVSRNKRLSRDHLLITLSSENDYETETKGLSNSENEVLRSLVKESQKAKRFAHYKADFFRKIAALRWSRHRKKCGGGHSTDSSSTNSVIAKVKKKARRKSIVNKVALARKRYFASKNLPRNKCLTARSNLRGPFLRARPHRKKKEISVQKRMVVQKRQSGRSSKQSQGHSSSHRQLPPGTVPAKRGRPRKYFPVDVSNTNSEFSSEQQMAMKQAKEISNEMKQDKISTDDESSRLSTSKSESSEKRAMADREIEAGTPPVVVKKRGRKLGMKLKTVHINRKIKPFVQNTSCFDIVPKVSKCRECRLLAYNKSSKKHQNSYCRFLDYRKLCYAKNGAILIAGFSLGTDCTDEDMRCWLPRPDYPPSDLSIETSKALLIQVGDQFCDLIEQEKEAVSMHVGSDKTLTWKRIVQGVREMCDVCDTTLFNIHWVCPKCGIAVCIDCYKVRKQGIVMENEEGSMKGRDEFMWFLCNARQPHELDKLIMAQIVPGRALWVMQETMHRARDVWKIASYCKCMPQASSNDTSKTIPTGICNQLMSSVPKSFLSNLSTQSQQNCNNPYEDRQPPKLDIEINDSAMNWLNCEKDNSNSYQEPLGYENGSVDDMCFNPCYESFTSLKNMLLQGGDNLPISDPMPPSSYLSFSLDEIIDSVIETKVERAKAKSEADTIKLFNHRYPQPNSGRDPLPIRIFTTTESSIIYSDVPHSWLCNGRLLLLHQPQHSKNLELFQEQWKRGQPIMVMGVDKRLDMSLWHPDGFCRDFGEIKNDLVNCKTGAIIPNLPMRKFWEGFENFEKRMKDDFGEYMLLKLKDWPPGEDFSEKLPKRFQDLMKGLPLPEYTHRDGIFNLAGRLPSWFVRPDLGPKMYNAYGSALYPAKGTTNLHLDISDAVNVMVYVGVPHDGKAEDHILEALKAIDEGGCDSLMRKRVRSRGVRPGALWHIYNARDADKIRDMLTKVAIERGEKLEAHHDPIHDQNWYIDAELRKRLYHEYGVEGYAIAQCLGDAVFIPAGAPHQVRNLHSCVKVAEDFVSPENIGHCFKLTQEFRHLSDTHTNHEDKLQIKNIIYHVVKDSLSHLIDAEAAKIYRLCELDL